MLLNALRLSFVCTIAAASLLQASVVVALTNPDDLTHFDSSGARLGVADNF